MKDINEAFEAATGNGVDITGGLIKEPSRQYGETPSMLTLVKKSDVEACIKERLADAIPGSFDVDFVTYNISTLAPVLVQHGIQTREKAVEIIRQIIASDKDKKVNVPVLRVERDAIKSVATGSFLSRTASDKVTDDVDLGFVREINSAFPLLIDGLKEENHTSGKVTLFFNLAQILVFVASDLCPSMFGAKNDPSKSNKYSMTITDNVQERHYALDIVKNSVNITKK